MILLLILSLLHTDPGSYWDIVTLSDIPQEALDYAWIAAENGGQAQLDLARLLELSGLFNEAAIEYRKVIVPDSNPGFTQWLLDRGAGCQILDTTIVLQTTIMNGGNSAITDITLLHPLPVSHPPYQELVVEGGDYDIKSSHLSMTIDTLPAGESVNAHLLLHVRQAPYTFRPIPGRIDGMELDAVSHLLSDIRVPEYYTGSGPCFDMALLMMEEAGRMGLSLGITGGLVRRGDSLDFHAWNILEEGTPGLPLDPLFWKTDSLFSMGHCPTDLIPLWDLLSTDGSELVVLYPDQDSYLLFSMKAYFQP